MHFEMKGDFKYEYFSSVTPSKIEWLWYPYIPYGKITVIQGDPGEGKSTFILNVAALLTRGKQMPDGYPVPSPQSVIYQSAEDNISDTVKPRLEEARADCDRVAYIVDNDDPLTISDMRIEKAIQQTGARMLILDPLQGYLSQDTDMLNVGRMRNQLKYLANVASKYNCAVVIVGHMNKSSGEKNLYRSLGSIDIVAIARSVLMIARDEENPLIRHMFQVKSNLAPKGATIAFSINKAGFCWIGRTEMEKSTQRKIVVAENKKSLVTKLLQDVLVGQDVPGKYIISKLKTMGVSERTVNSAKKEMGIMSYRNANEWYWHLPDKDEKVLEDRQ